VADGESGLQVLDVTRPAKPSLTGYRDIDGYATIVTVSGDYAYLSSQHVGVGGGGGLQIFRLSDPSNPILVGMPHPYYQEQVLGLDVRDDYVYAGVTNGFAVIDVTNPATPKQIGSLSSVKTGLDVCVSGDYAYVAMRDSAFAIIDISDPTNPESVGEFDAGNAYSVDVSGNYAYAVDVEYGLYVIDVSDPSNPISVGTYPIAPTTIAWHVRVSGGYAYVAGYGDMEFMIFSFANPASPQLAGSLALPEDHAGRVAILGKYAYLAYRNLGLYIIDIGDPTKPSLVGSYDTPNDAESVAIFQR
jgi:hypothetical protein